MKKLILILAFFGTVLLANAKTNELANINWTSYPGANLTNWCAIYANAVSKDLGSRGIQTYYVEFEWESGKEDGAHAIVIFHANNTWYVIDNECPTPRWVNYRKDFRKIVKQRYDYVKVTRVRTITPVGLLERLTALAANQ